jgi:Cna protein B-type domain.
VSNRFSRTLRWLTLASFLLPFAHAAAQNTTAGAISGTITDTTGALLSNVQITVTNQGTRQVSTATTSNKGFYSVENLGSGNYTVTATLTGFKQISLKNLHLDPGHRRGQDFQLVIGNVDTNVDVQADTVAVQTESAESGGTISAKEVANLMRQYHPFH